MSVPERREMVERPGENLSVRRKCARVNLARSGVYRPGPVTGADDLALMRRIDELHLKWPIYGSARNALTRNPATAGTDTNRAGVISARGSKSAAPPPHPLTPPPPHNVYLSAF